ncbi:hypothetical protein [Yinghuangia soli]|uniref:Uncharacterized protein n=1 Tax=Yinghuangia soli TaxID=2908204 RepID=A0AA41PUU1_9ACTN|nr:hypothetical protein [Yinghuangia soli]MCF2525725.1 hypothetical protein [Yinghuangia soli]
MDGICNGCGGSGQGVGDLSCGGCGGGGRMQQMQPCPSCGGSGGFADHGGYAQQQYYGPPQAPMSRGQRIRSKVTSLLVFAVLAGYVYYTTR